MVLGGALTVDAQYGKATVPLDDVAVLVGGAGIGRPMRLLLRNGESLVGTVTADELILEAESGLELELVPKYVNTLFLHADPADGKPSPEAGALLKTHRGDQLGVRFTPDATVRATTAWGPVEVPLNQVDFLYPIREPHPIHRLLMNDKTRLSAVLSGADLEWSTLHFDKVKIAPGAIARLASVKADRSAEEDDEEEILKVPHCQLAGGNIMVGTIDAARIEIETAGGVTPLDARLVRLIDRVEEEDDALFSFELDNGTKLEGRLRDGILPIRALDTSWKIPAYHVQMYRWPKEEESPSSAPQNPLPRPVPPPQNKKPVRDPADLFGPPAPQPQPQPVPPGTDPFAPPGGTDPFGGNPFGMRDTRPAASRI
jgi:hypothetical protein